jgi:hypothetical protein
MTESGPSSTAIVGARLLAGAALVGTVGAMFALEIPWPHLSRCGLAGLGLALAAWALVHRRWLAFAIGLAGAVAAWGLVPSFQGDSLWTAWGDAEKLAIRARVLPPTDRKGFEAEAAKRQRLMAGFPLLRQRLADAEADWRQRREKATAALRKRILDAKREAHAERQAKGLAAADELAEVKAKALRQEAAALEVEKEVDDFRDYFAALALLERRAGGGKKAP